VPAAPAGSRSAASQNQASTSKRNESGTACRTAEKKSGRKRLREDDNQDAGNESDSDSDEGDGLGMTGSITVGGIGKGGKKRKGTRLYVFFCSSV